MKYLTAITALFVASSFANADVIGVKGDFGLWRADIGGELGALGSGELGYSDEEYQYAHLLIEHPIPLIPNGRIAYADISAHHSRAGIDSQIDLTHLDATAYYEILDNWLNLDLGFSLRQFDGAVSLGSERTELNDVLPMGYAYVEAELPFTGWSANLELNYTQFDDYTVGDYTAKLRYLFDSVLDVGFEAGYRTFRLDLEKGLGANLDTKGPFVGLAFHF